MGKPIFPDVAMNLAKPSSPVTARVISNESCLAGKSASFVKHLVLDISDTPLRNMIAPGQAFGVIAPGLNEKGKPNKVRLYSNASPSWGETDSGIQISTTPKRLIDEYLPGQKEDRIRAQSLFLGVCSNYLCDLQPGDSVQISGPNGQRFLLPVAPEQHDYLFLATGTGIAPFRGMLLELLENPSADPCRSHIDLVMGTPYRTDLLYDDLFRRLAEKHENFHYHTAISREPSAAGGHGQYVHDLIEQQFAHFYPLLTSQRTLIYACGLEAMRYGVVRLMAKHDLGSAYFRVNDPLKIDNWESWTNAEIRKHVKPGGRTFLEVY